MINGDNFLETVHTPLDDIENHNPNGITAEVMYLNYLILALTWVGRVVRGTARNEDWFGFPFGISQKDLNQVCVDVNRILESRGLPHRIGNSMGELRMGRKS